MLLWCPPVHLTICPNLLRRSKSRGVVAGNEASESNSSVREFGPDTIEATAHDHGSEACRVLFARISIENGHELEPHLVD